MDNKVPKYLAIQISIFVTLIASLIFYFQNFLKVNHAFGIDSFTITGYEIIFGCTKTYYQIVSGGRIEKSMTFNPSIMVLFSWILLVLTFLIQIVCLILKYKQNKYWMHINLICAILPIISGITILFSNKLFEIANHSELSMFSQHPCITTAIFIISIGIIISLNSFDLILNKIKKSS